MFNTQRGARDIMHKFVRPSLILFSCTLSLLPMQAQYTARRTGEVVELSDQTHDVVVSIAPSIGDLVFAMKVKGHNVLRFPYASLDDYRARPALAGIPFLGPWANRLDEQAFYANGKKYIFNMSLG